MRRGQSGDDDCLHAYFAKARFQVGSDEGAVDLFLNHRLLSEGGRFLFEFAAGLSWPERRRRDGREMLHMKKRPPRLAPGLQQAGGVAFRARIVSRSPIFQVIESLLDVD